VKNRLTHISAFPVFFVKSSYPIDYPTFILNLLFVTPPKTHATPLTYAVVGFLKKKRIKIIATPTRISRHLS
jgi:hypothetical protein